MSKRSEIVQKFLQIADNADKCCNFPLKEWLEKYEQCTDDQINFSEAAFLIVSSGKIYGRKVDYLEQLVHEYNRESAANIKEAEKEIEKQTKLHDNQNIENEKTKSTNDENEKEKLNKRQKRLLKLNNKIEFKPKQFIIANQTQISLNIHEQREEFDDDEQFEQLRMKNVFPRINILQSNLQNNTSFYDNLDIIDKNCDNLDSLRDYRIFMDTIDEPIKFDINADVDKQIEKCSINDTENMNKSQKHFNAYLPAEHIKKVYGVDIVDNNDYLNMLKYGEEVERLNLRQMTIEQLGKLKVGTYLNNILHGNKQDNYIPEHDSGMGDSICDSFNTSCESTITSAGANSTIISTTIPATIALTETINGSTNTITSDQSVFNDSGCLETINETTHCVTDESNVDESINDQNTLNDDSVTENEPNDNNESAKINESIELRNSLDDGLGASLVHSPVQLNELDAYERNMLNPIVEMRDIFYPMNKYIDMPDNLTIDLNGPLKNLFLFKDVQSNVPTLELNIFQIPEQLLRRPKIFQLTDDFDLWLAARKRKARDPIETTRKLMKLSDMQTFQNIADNNHDESDGLLGFDVDMNAVFDNTNLLLPNDTNLSLNLNDSKALNDTAHDSGFISEFNETNNGDTSMELSMNLDDNVNGNSTKINETQSTIDNETGVESAFETTGNTTADLSTTYDHDNDDMDRNDDLEETHRIDDTNQSDEMRDMIERVSKWHEQLRPILQHSEKRNNFDIHALGTDIIDLFPANNKSHEISFANIMENRDPSYTARYFLSLLLLTNTKNVKIDVNHNGDSTAKKKLCEPNNLKIQLLSRSRHLDQVNKINEHLTQPKDKKHLKRKHQKSSNDDDDGYM